jgi:hypothetical protein
MAGSPGHICGWQYRESHNNFTRRAVVRQGEKRYLVPFFTAAKKIPGTFFLVPFFTVRPGSGWGDWAKKNEKALFDLSIPTAPLV